MLSKIIIDEVNDGYKSIVDFNTKKFMGVKNDNIVFVKGIVDNDIIINLVNDYVTFWNTKYINNNIFDGNYTKIIIYYNKDIVTYEFKNKYPDNYSSFIGKFNEIVSSL